MATMFDEHSPLAWIAFNVLILAILAADLGLFHRKPREIPVREALWTTAGYIVLALLFNGWVYWQFGEQRAVEFLTGYFIEYALSMDNILVFVVILAYFQVPAHFQMRLLLWGILGSLVLRGMFILAGFALIEAFDWTVVILGLFLIYTGFKTMSRAMTDRSKGEPLSKSRRWLIPVTHEYHGQRYFTRLSTGKARGDPSVSCARRFEHHRHRFRIRIPYRRSLRLRAIHSSSTRRMFSRSLALGRCISRCLAWSTSSAI